MSILAKYNLLFNPNLNSKQLKVKVWAVVLFAVVFFGCTQKLEPIPDDVLPPEKMAQLLTRIHIAESLTMNAALGLDSSVVYFNNLQTKIFEDLKVDSAQYNRSLKFYSSSPMQADKLYEAVVDSLGLRNTLGKWD